MIFVITVVGLFICLNLYFRIADKFNIIDKPNHRSSHKVITIRGGGIVFYLGYSLYEFFLSQESSFFVFAGVTLLAVVSFIDDLKGLSSKLRFPIQVISVALILQDLSLFSYPWWIIAPAIVVATGFLNAYNFMDGINGITTLYTIVVLGSLHLYQSNWSVDTALVFEPLYASLLVFGFYNLRKRARCFSGDIGSITLGVLVVYLTVNTIVESSYFGVLLFVSVYLIDSGYTILIRLFNKENIFEAHRSHLYQILANENGYSHVMISLMYAVVQLLVNLMIVINLRYGIIEGYFLELTLIVVLSLLFWALRRYYMKRGAVLDVS